MKHRGFEKRQVASQLGEVTLSRRCYTCPKGCGGYAPFDARLGLYGKWSTGMQEWMQYAAAKDSFDGGAESIEKFSGVVASASSVREVAEWHGTRKEEEQQRAIEDARGRMTRPADDSATPHRLYVGVDGAHVPERPEWKECKVGVVFATSSKRPLTPRRRTYVAGIEPVELFGERLNVFAGRRGMESAREVICLGDGAPWIWDMMSTYYPHATQILDFFHACEHLHAARLLRWNDKEPDGDWWERAQQARLKRGWRDAFAQGFDQLPPSADGRDKAWNYFETNRPRMHYREYRARRLFIGSGIVESGCKQIVTRRMKITGARWLHGGAQAIVQIRVAYLNGGYAPPSRLRAAA